MDQPSPIVEEHPLRDYWNVLVKRWPVVVIMTAVFVVGGFLHRVRSSPEPFPHIAVIEIGSAGTPEEARAKIQGAFIPQALSEHAEKNGYEETRYGVDADLADSAGLLTLHAFGGASATKDLLGIEQRVIDLLLKSQKIKEEALRSSLRSDKNRAEIELEALQQEQKFFPAKFRRIDDQAALLQSRIGEAADAINDLEQKRSVLLSSGTSNPRVTEPSVSTFFIIDGDIQRQREKKRDFEEQLNVEVRRDREDLEKQQIENERKEKEQQRLVNEIQLNIDTLKITQVLFPPQRQLRSQPAPIRNTLAFAAVLGFLFGIFAAFFVEFALNARKNQGVRVVS